ncbi:MAG: Ni/Fe-hydrogenase, b-type cytochrome subunit [Flavobacteriaceae bacterium CG_4_8_14_3_um_filter_34_10]|nr:Ni/Fe-hydrogenase, b-type cytochrome subunit [Flavobacteriia bacterium]OIP49345.1 MAG: Ni/Fe-hydrogenase, b-type cytochrome subunit [Flavobacteriaceae bacterium CG2_30_34_30]PIQ19441.1 MAG: Ni/Fe-hydrogenase, b-type cytochrome subunit [Flavobacteriaceae bacterium CG18_big_fil_WC_8_21_14_2_50_34_36]PIV50082.1 MAG: Ni/Fe-hydrogenase, b-type cytochrome subunit [Flavobacteriaceae bacterium CG02_land_8_20_14_3_00_34_13]PIX09153.1 MAG: Ni/Fe-hydrogenase, b-type cytochrome subunit [Flavobacteriacea
MITKNFQRVYIWELPVRIFHWVNVLAILVLITTGLFISNPLAILSSAEASEIYWFGTVRFIHFTAAYIFFFNMIFRIYWSFVGNKYASWRAMLPLHKNWFENFFHVLKVDILLQNEKNPEFSDISVGHNNIAGISYVVLFLLALLQVFTGFGLYSSTSQWWLPQLFAWVVPFLGGDFMARTLHHIATWGFILFIFIHVYLVFYHDWLEGRGEVSSMFGGYKFVNKKRINSKKKSKKIVETEKI